MKWYPEEQYSTPIIDGNDYDPLMSVKDKTIATYIPNSFIYSNGYSYPSFSKISRSSGFSYSLYICLISFINSD